MQLHVTVPLFVLTRFVFSVFAFSCVLCYSVFLCVHVLIQAVLTLCTDVVLMASLLLKDGISLDAQVK